jgi:hypothetical protein
MMFVRSLVAFSLLGSVVVGEEALSALKEGEFDFQVENRVLAQANGKPITALDVLKRMDFLFYRQYPDYISSNAAKYQYYQANWKEILEELIDRELMRADAVETKVEVLSSDVRQELEQTFGPDIISNLDKIGMRLDEAMAMLKDELMIRKVMMYKINSRAYRAVGPLEIKSAYEKWIATNKESEKWCYQTVTLRGPEENEGLNAARYIREELLKGLPLEIVRDEVIKEGILPASISLTVSDTYLHPQDEVPPLIYPHLSTLSVGDVSEPFSQLSRKTGEVAVRLILLNDKIAAHVAPLKEVETRLKNQLLQDGVEEESKKYLNSLRERYHVSHEPRGDQGIPVMIIPRI